MPSRAVRHWPKPCHAVDKAHQAMRAVDNRGIDDIALARPPAFDQRRKNASDKEHRPAAEIADHVERRHGRLAILANRVQHAGHADIIDVMPRHLAPRAALPPAGHAAIDKAGIDGMTCVRADAHALSHAGAEAFDQDIGLGNQLEQRFDRFGLF